MTMNIIPTAEPFFFPGNRTGCLLIHGFTGAPKEMRWMGEYLAGQGFSVLGVRLAGHATRPQDLERVRWTDWVTSVEDGWHLLQGATERIFLIGLSMGGVLALYCASYLPAAGVVAMSTPFELPPDPRKRLLKLLQWVIPTVPKGAPDWRNPQAARDHVDYPGYPTRGIVQLEELIYAMQAALPEVTVPVLLVHSKRDTGVAPQNMPKIADRLGSRDKNMLWVENSGHVVTREPDRERIFEAAADFIRRVSREKA